MKNENKCFLYFEVIVCVKSVFPSFVFIFLMHALYFTLNLELFFLPLLFLDTPGPLVPMPKGTAEGKLECL